MTPGQRWRYRRNLVLFVAHERGGVSQRTLADVFDLSRRRVKAILDEFGRKTRRGEIDGSTPGSPG